MSSKANPTFVGGFVLSAIALLVASVFLFGGGRMFRGSETFVAYFEGSLSGLDIGAPVTFRGVRIGSVKNILSVYDIDRDLIYFPVVFAIEDDHFTVLGDESNVAFDPEDDTAAMNHLFENGLRATLEMRSFVTGQLNVELDMYPDAPLTLKKFPSPHIEFPTTPSGIQELAATVRRMIERLKDVPLEEILEDASGTLVAIRELVSSDALKDTIAGADSLINSPDLAASISSLRSALDHFDQASQSAARMMDAVEPEIQPLAAEVLATSRKMQAALEDMQGAIETFEQSLAEDSELSVRTTQAMDEVQRAARSMRILAEFLERHPEALIRGKQRPGGGE